MPTSTVTLEHTVPMSRSQGLLLRGNRWYSNIKVPADLVPAFGKQILRLALKTSDYREACRRIVYEKARCMALFDEARAKLAKLTPVMPSEKRLIVALSDREAFELALQYLAKNEGGMRNWMADAGRSLPPYELRELKENLIEETAHYAGEMEFQEASDGADETRTFLLELGLDCAPTSPAFKTLQKLIFQAHIEYLERSSDLVSRKPVQERNNLFKNVHSHSPMAKALTGPTVNDLISNHEKRHRLKKRSVKTVIAARPALRLLREVLGGSKRLSSITFDDMDRLFEIMQQVPLNATQRYPKMSYLKAIEEAEKRGDTNRPSANTNWATFAHIRAAFTFGVEDELLEKNWAAAPRYSDMFQKEEGELRDQFSVEELNLLFRAPLYTGCIDDERLYAKAGNSRPRRGRFWVPLLALFHGMRNNEACQIYTEDVKCEVGVHYIAVRETLDTEKISEKKLKTKRSIRQVPIHPELIKIGFLDFVEGRRNDDVSPRLFPEIKPGNTGYFSDSFSKWFSRFAKGTLPGCKATLHSFRHQFRDATRVARLSDETVGRIAGWDDGGRGERKQMNRYGSEIHRIPFLREEIEKVKYPGLDLSHLYISTKRPKIPRSTVGRVRDD